MTLEKDGLVKRSKETRARSKEIRSHSRDLVKAARQLVDQLKEENTSQEEPKKKSKPMKMAS
jgi:hypothetical protein